MSQIFFPTSFLPPIPWIANSLQHDALTIEVHETYPKQTIRNRCHIANAGGKFNLIVPVVKPNGNHTKTMDIKIDNSQPWQRTHWRSIMAAYNKSPYFIYYRDSFEIVFAKQHEFLIELNHELIEVVFKLLKAKIDINYTSEFPKNSIKDGRVELFSAKKSDFDLDANNQPRYMQVFEPNLGFLPGLSIVDLLFNMGPETLDYLLQLSPKPQ